jgi:RNA polymerase sigma-70 factor, ECF subfamily
MPYSPSDTDLIGRFLDGDERAFRLLYERHTPKLKMTLLRLLGRISHEVEDVVQDTWLAGCRSIHTFRGEAKFSTWLTTIGVRTALAQLRRHKHPEVELDTAEPATAAIDHHTDAGIDVERALAMLPDQQRIVVVLHDLEGLTHEDIGNLLGIASGTSKATLSYARAALRTVFAKEEEA